MRSSRSPFESGVFEPTPTKLKLTFPPAATLPSKSVVDEVISVKINKLKSSAEGTVIVLSQATQWQVEVGGI